MLSKKVIKNVLVICCESLLLHNGKVFIDNEFFVTKYINEI